MSVLLALMLAAGGPNLKKIGPDDVRAVAQQFATCVVKRHGNIAETYVLDRSLWLEQKAFRKLFDPDCVPTNGSGFRILSGKRQQISFALAEALVRLHYPSPTGATVLNAAPLKHDFAPSEPKPAKPPTADELVAQERERMANEAISVLGECVVRANPAAAHGLLLTKVGSDLETQYLAALQPAAGNCIEKGASISLTKYSLRGTIALNLYRLSKAPRIAPGGTR